MRPSIHFFIIEKFEVREHLFRRESTLKACSLPNSAYCNDPSYLLQSPNVDK